MNKLIMSLAMVAAAFSMHAASVDWGFAEMSQTSKTPYDLDGYSAYLFTASTWEGFAEVTADAFSSAVDNAALTKTTMGTALVQWQTGNQTWTDDKAVSGNYYVVLFNGKDYTAGSVSATAYASAQESHTAGLWQITAANTPLAASNFTAASVPEPTSGLLILLGMAGLALKRKHA